MRVSDLWDSHVGETAWIVGTGPSMRVFPTDFLKGKFVIGLNQAWRYVDVTHLLTIHPHESEVVPSRDHFPPGTLITKAKGRGWSSRLKADDPDIYIFETRKDIHDLSSIEQRHPDVLYAGRGIQASAIVLAAHMGCRYAVLVGCDMCSLNGEHHGHDQHVRFHGLTDEEVYGEYYGCTATVRDKCLELFGMETLTLSPFVGLSHIGQDYARRCKMAELAPLPEPEDTSAYDRPPDAFG